MRLGVLVLVHEVAGLGTSRTVRMHEDPRVLCPDYSVAQECHNGKAYLYLHSVTGCDTSQMAVPMEITCT